MSELKPLIEAVRAASSAAERTRARSAELIARTEELLEFGRQLRGEPIRRKPEVGPPLAGGTSVSASGRGPAWPMPWPRGLLIARWPAVATTPSPW